MTLIVSLILAVLTFAFIAYPFFRQGPAASTVRESRSEKAASVEDEIEKGVQELRQRAQSGGRFCPSCGARALKGDRFCGECGANLAGWRRRR